MEVAIPLKLARKGERIRGEMEGVVERGPNKTTNVEYSIKYSTTDGSLNENT